MISYLWNIKQHSIYVSKQGVDLFTQKKKQGVDHLIDSEFFTSTNLFEDRFCVVKKRSRICLKLINNFKSDKGFTRMHGENWWRQICRKAKEPIFAFGLLGPGKWSVTHQTAASGNWLGPVDHFFFVSTLGRPKANIVFFFFLNS